jgi:hypothetical protein
MATEVAGVGVADELDGGVAEAFADDWFEPWPASAAVAGFLQADKLSAKTSAKSANRLRISEVRGL